MLTHAEWKAISLAVEREVVYGIRLMLYALKTGELSIEDLKFAILKKADDFMIEAHQASERSFSIVVEPSTKAENVSNLNNQINKNDCGVGDEQVQTDTLLSIARDSDVPYFTRDNCSPQYSQHMIDALNGVLTVISENPCIQRRQIVDKLGLSVRSVRTALSKLKDEYKLIETDKQCYHGWRLKQPLP